MDILLPHLVRQKTLRKAYLLWRRRNKNQVCSAIESYVKEDRLLDIVIDCFISCWWVEWDDCRVASVAQMSTLDSRGKGADGDLNQLLTSKSPYVCMWSLVSAYTPTVWRLESKNVSNSKTRQEKEDTEKEAESMQMSISMTKKDDLQDCTSFCEHRFCFTSLTVLAFWSFRISVLFPRTSTNGRIRNDNKQQRD